MRPRPPRKEPLTVKKPDQKVDLISLEKHELRKLVQQLGAEPYRATQVFGWLHARLATSFSDMTNIPIRLRKALEVSSRIGSISRTATQTSPADDAVKFLFSTGDGTEFESVMMGSGRKFTFCLSSQIGCMLGCVFCATGKMGFVRDLSPGEMVAQFLALRRELAPEVERVNIVMMGMGEPLLNYSNTTKALRILCDQQGSNVGKRRITISTAGIVPAIRKLAEEKAPWGLAISLNAAHDELRNKLMPINRTYPIREVLKAARGFAARTRRRLTLEYVLMSGVNDSRREALRLAALASELPCKVNVIPYNPVPGAEFRSPSEEEIESFLELLYPRCPAVTVRRSKGSEILAACGQLARPRSGRDGIGCGRADFVV